MFSFRWLSQRWLIFLVGASWLIPSDADDIPTTGGYWSGLLPHLVADESVFLDHLVAVDDTGAPVADAVRRDQVQWCNISRWNGHAWDQLGRRDRPLRVTGAIRHGSLLVGIAGSNLVSRPLDGPTPTEPTDWQTLGQVEGGIPGPLASDGQTLLVSGAFTGVSGVAAAGLAQWSGSQWVAMDRELPGTPTALAVSGDTAFAVCPGPSTSTRTVVRWNGDRWEVIGVAELESESVAEPRLAIQDHRLLVGGPVRTVAGVTTPRLAIWDNSGWHPAANDWAAGYVVGVTESETGPLVFGSIGVERDGQTNWAAILQLQGTTWVPLLEGETNRIQRVFRHHEELFAEGQIRMSNGTLLKTVWHFDGRRWQSLVAPTTSDLQTPRLAGIAVTSRGLLVSKAGGSRLITAGFDRQHLWTDGTRLEATSVALNTPNTFLDISSRVTTVGDRVVAPALLIDATAGTTNSLLVRLDDQLVWRIITPPTPEPLYIGRIAGDGNRFFVVGPSLVPFDNNTKLFLWDGEHWTEIARPTLKDSSLLYSPFINDLTLFQSRPWIITTNGGCFFHDGLSWEKVAEWHAHSAKRLAASATAVYATGAFVDATGVGHDGIQRWDGSQWSLLPALTSLHPEVLGVSPDDLVAVIGSLNGRTATNILIWRNGIWQTNASSITAFTTFRQPGELAWRGRDLYAVGWLLSPGFPSGAVWHEPVLHSLITRPNGISVEVTGATAGRPVIERSMDLQRWTPIATNALLNPHPRFRDPEPPPEGAFYRVRELD